MGRPLASEEPLLLTADEWPVRREKLRAALSSLGLPAAIVVGRSFYDRVGDLAYLTGHFPPFPASVSSGEYRGVGHAILLVTASAEPTLLVDGFSREDLLDIEDVRPSTNLVAALASLLEERSLHAGAIGLAGEEILPWGFARELAVRCPRLELKSVESIMRDLRRIKSPAEQELLRRAARVAEAGLAAARAAVRPGVSERVVSAAGIAAATEAGADFIRYLRVHSGPWSARASRWPPATDRILEYGDLVLLDIIGAAAGYQFDVLRMTSTGDPSQEDRRLLEAVDASVAAAIGMARPGVAAGAIARRAREVLDERGYGENASRFVGHGIGLETVEEPYLTAESTMTLASGMVLCVEPAVWIAGRRGASIEQEIVIREGSAELITPSPTVLW